MRIRTVIFISLFVAFTFSDAYAASVSVKDRNIFYESNGKTKQLTSLGRDAKPALNPNGEWVYFVRQSQGKWVGEKYYPAKGEIIEDGLLKEELWRIRIDGTEAALLFRNNYTASDGPDPDYAVAGIENIQFSPDGDKVYFETLHWVTSCALHVMNPDGSDEKMLGPGNETKIVISAREVDPKYGSCRGCIVTAQHNYWWFGGSYDWWYLFTPDFKEIGPLGDDFNYFAEMGEIKYTDQSEKNIGKSEKIRPVH